MNQPSTAQVTSSPRSRSRRRRPVALLAAVLAGAGLAACGGAAAASGTAAPDCAASAPKLTVDASGQAAAPPDQLTLDIGVSVSGATASDTLTAADTQAASLSSTLTGAGVAASDLTTTGFSIQPTTGPTGEITGYQVDNTLVVTLHDLVHAGAVIDAAARSVGDAVRLDGLTYSIGNTGDIDGQARANAVRTAEAHAQAMARASGGSLHGVCSISDATTQPVGYAAAGTSFNAAQGDAAVPLQAGTQQATAQVSVVYALS